MINRQGENKSFGPIFLVTMVPISTLIIGYQQREREGREQHLQYGTETLRDFPGKALKGSWGKEKALLKGQAK